MKKIVFVGTNPSEKSKTNTAFEPGTKSLNTLIDWVTRAGLIGVDKSHANIYNHKTPRNRPLTKDEIEIGVMALQIKLFAMHATHVVALGKTAAKALTKYKIKHLEMPHPSGLNRKLNDPAYVEEQIAKLKAYYDGPG